MVDDANFYDDDMIDDSIDFGELVLSDEDESAKPQLSDMPMFQSLFTDAVLGDAILESFAENVVGNLSDRFALKTAKGGAFFQERQAEGMVNATRFQRDQSLRAHLINGMLPALRLIRTLVMWGAPLLREWDVKHERLFITGYMLHDYTKIEEVQTALTEAGFYPGEAPNERQVEVLEPIFREWCVTLGLDAFLQPIGGSEPYLQDLIYIACNTQRLKGTARNAHLYTRLNLDSDTREVLADASRLADLIAYVAPTPRDLVAHKAINKLINRELGFDSVAVRSVGRLVYHHVAENRGLLLNFIHNAVMKALENEARMPLLYAPSGVVYLERHDAPAMPPIDDLITNMVEDIRQTMGEKLIRTGKGAKRGNTFLQVDASYDDFFSLPEMISHSMGLIERYIYTNKTPLRFEAMKVNGWTGWDNIPDNLSIDVTDARADQIAEWAGFVETQFRDRFDKDTTQIVQWLLNEFKITDLEADFLILKSEATKGGLRYWWHWAAAHALGRQSTMDDIAVQNWLRGLSQKLISELSETLPQKAKANPETWDSLAHYIKQVLSIGGTKSHTSLQTNELESYTNAKSRKGKAICAICGSDYPTRAPSETAVAFQPGVYTQRLRMGTSNNKRNLCSICALEQLLRQLYTENLDAGGKAESQRIRYLSFYPAYFFSPETLKMVQRAYGFIKAIRLSDKDLWRALRAQDDLMNVSFWQRLDAFLIRPDGQVDETKFKKVLRYSDSAQSTFFTIGFRNLEPTETESWVLPAFLALVMSICLDVKVVASDSGIPLMLESSELPETVWFDGAHASVLQMVEESRLNLDNIGLALARLVVAYLIHLDTEYAPPKENWQRFMPIANALCDSPLYVFHYLKKQERDDKPLSFDKVRRYIGYATLFTRKGDEDMSHANKLVTLYRGFYRAKSIKNANSILRPLSVVSDALLTADPRLFNDTQALVEVAHGELYRFMDRVGKGLADGRFPKGISRPEREDAIRDFSVYFVTNVFEGVFNKDVSALRGKQLNLLKSACEVIYRSEQAKEWTEAVRDDDDVDDADEN